MQGNGSDMMERLEYLLFDAYEGRYIEYRDIRGEPRQLWTFPSAIFFASTIITTIGEVQL